VWLIGLPACALPPSRRRGLLPTPEGRRPGRRLGLPGLELLMDEPQRKADVWKAMRQLMARWKSVE
jgi:hypothetical protein